MKDEGIELSTTFLSRLSSLASQMSRLRPHFLEYVGRQSFAEHPCDRRILAQHRSFLEEGTGRLHGITEGNWAQDRVKLPA